MKLSEKIPLIPGRHLCDQCFQKVEIESQSLLCVDDHCDDDSESSQEVLSSQEIVLSQNSNHIKELLTVSHNRLDVLTNALGESPVKNMQDINKLNQEQRVQYSKRKCLSLGTAVYGEVSAACHAQALP